MKHTQEKYVILPKFLLTEILTHITRNIFFSPITNHLHHEEYNGDLSYNLFKLIKQHTREIFSIQISLLRKKYSSSRKQTTTETETENKDKDKD